MSHLTKPMAAIAGVSALLLGVSLPAPSLNAGTGAGGGSFVPAGSLVEARTHHTATLLDDGRVLVVGGTADGASLASAELWDPATGSFGPTGSLEEARGSHTATLLDDGRVLVVGGTADGASLASAELWDPATGSFGPTGSLDEARGSHTATLLDDGRVLVVGGSVRTDGDFVSLASTELWDPDTSSFGHGETLAAARSWHTATLLPDGGVLIIGGSATSALDSAELRDATSGSFVAGGSLAEARSLHTATLLPDGGVLVIGGYSYDSMPTAELRDASSGSFAPAGSLAEARSIHTATLLPDGRVLVVGGDGVITDEGYVPIASAELWDPAGGSFVPTRPLAEPRSAHSATLLPDGGVLVIGGGGASGDVLASAERWQPTDLLPPPSDRPDDIDGALALAELLSLLPEGMETCRPGTPLAEGQRAVVQCSFGEDMVVYASFDDLASLTAAYDGVAASAGVEGGTSCDVGPFEGPYLASDGTPAGRVVCQVGEGGALLGWTDERNLLLGFVQLAEGDFPELHGHWLEVRLEHSRPGSASPVPPGSVIRQWAESAVASSEYTSTDWSAGQATGRPDTADYGDHVTAWAPSSSDGGVEWLELTYARPVLPTEVVVWESSGSGAVTMIEAFDDASATWMTLWKGTDPSPDALATFGPPLAETTLPTRRLRVTIDATKPGWNEIDAVELVGTSPDE